MTDNSAAIGRVSGSEFAARAPLAPSKDRKQRKGFTVYLEPSDKERLDREPVELQQTAGCG